VLAGEGVMLGTVCHLGNKLFLRVSPIITLASEVGALRIDMISVL